MEEKQKLTFDNSEKWIDCLFTTISFIVLTTAVLGDQHNVFAYYQSLPIFISSATVAILNISKEIDNNISIDLYPPPWICVAYNACKFLAYICSVISLGIFLISGNLEYVKKHLYNNEYWGVCLFTLVPSLILLFFGYIYPTFKKIPYKYKNIRLAERTDT